MAGSRFLSPAEKNYAVVELELLAIQWAVKKCRLYLAGADFMVVTDHQPLLGIFNRKNLDAINNTHIQRLMAKLLGYCFKVVWAQEKITSLPTRFPELRFSKRRAMVTSSFDGSQEVSKMKH